ncbi:CBS domain-containing protein [Candidatus Micrarchaeota archaeon]|nr:CBS domain-containing protein [Candidatus Micrarchaeota archaeon]
MIVRDIMRTNFVSFQADDRLKHILKVFAEKKVSSAPVFDGEDYLGIVSDAMLIKYFLPKKFLFWNAKKEIPIESIKNIIAKNLARKGRMYLKPEQKVESVAVRVSRGDACIPVIENKRVVGIVRKEDLVVKVLLKHFAKKAGEKKMGTERGKELHTELDKILEMVNDGGEVPAWSIAKKLGISLKTVETLAESLERHHLVKTRYAWLGGMKLRRIEDG